MTPEVQQYLLMYQSTQQYLKLSPSYCEYLGGLRWSDREDALVYPDGRHVAFNEAVAEFLEGFHTGGRIISFSYILHWIDLLQNLRDLDLALVRRSQELFQANGANWRNAGALAAVVSQEVPEVPQAPQLEMICRRLRDRAFPIRWYAARFHDSPEVPPLLPEAFQEQVLHQLAAYADDDLRAWFATGRGPIRKAGAALAQEPPQPRTVAGVLAELLQRPRLAGAETYVPQLVSALALPPRRLTPQELPLGGYADMVTRGQVEDLLPSQHALDDLEFLRRFAERELLFFRREEPPAPHKQELVVLLDQGVRTWGDVRLVLAAGAVALAQQALARKVPFTLAGTSNGGRPVELQAQDGEALGRLVEASDLSPDPGLALETLLETPSQALRDVVLLTHPRNLRAADVLAAARRVGPRDRLFAVSLDGDGQAEVSEVRHGSPVRLRQFHVEFTPAPAPPPPVPDAVPGIGWSGDVEPIPYPFRMGTDGAITHFDFDHEGRFLLTVSSHGLLHLWKLDGGGQECLPRPRRGALLGDEILEVIGVVGGFVLACRHRSQLFLAHYELARRTCMVHFLAARELRSVQLFYSRDLHCIVFTNRERSAAVGWDLATRLVYCREQGGPASRAKQAVLRLITGELLERGRMLAIASSAEALARAAGDVAGMCHVEPVTGMVRLQGRVPGSTSFVPLADGRPLLKGAHLSGAQLAHGLLALRVKRNGDPLAFVFRGPDWKVRGEYMLARPGQRVQQLLVSLDGRWLGLLRSDQRVETQDVVGPGPGLTTRAGGFSGDPHLFVGERYLLLSVGMRRQFWHLLDWQSGTLQYTYEHCVQGHVSQPDKFTQPALRACLGRSRPLLALRDRVPEGFSYDPQRFVAGLTLLQDMHVQPGVVIDVSASVPVRSMLLFAQDRYGQVAILDGRGTLACMVMAFRERLAVWLPDGTRYGTTLLSTEKATPGAREKIAQALLAAERGPVS